MAKKEYKTKHFRSVKRFIDRLSPMNPHVKGCPNWFIYRGQANSDWPLLPKILRENKSNPLKRVAFSMMNTRWEKLSFEAKMLQTFVDACDSQGLHVPGDLRIVMDQDPTDRQRTWPRPEVLQALAAAQHHGVPTRLLDWTKRSFVAAYFAASSAIENKIDIEEGKNIAVWELNVEAKKLYSEIVEIINLPGATSLNLAAQAGCFTCIRKPYSEFPDKELESNELESNEALDGIQGDHLDFLQKITISASKAKDILDYCEAIGITASLLFPGYDGAAKAVENWVNSVAFVQRNVPRVEDRISFNE